MVGPEEYREALKRFAAGVTIVTVAHGGLVHGLTVTALAAVSLQPPLVLVCLEKGSRTRELILQSGRFVVNILNESQDELARRFATKGEKTLEDIPHRLVEGGIPALEGAISTIVCSTVNVTDGGDHEVFLASVLETWTAPGQPLVYYNRDYRSLSSD